MVVGYSFIKVFINLVFIRLFLGLGKFLKRVIYGFCFESMNYKGNNLFRVLGIYIFCRFYMFLGLKKCKL